MNNTSESKNVSQTVIDNIQQMIIDEKLNEGDKLPPERTLTELMGVGRPALREALKALELLGLLESRHGLGNYIVNNVQKNHFKPLALSFKLSHGTYQEIWDMRYCMESFAAKSAARNANAEDVALLKDLLKQMISAETPSEKAEVDRALHFEIGRASKNQLVNSTLESISFLIDDFIDHSVQLSYFEGDSIENIYKEHTAIINAIENHDEDRAETAMKKHLSMVDISRI